MTHVHTLESVLINNESIVTIGVFDGVHRGHQALIRQLVERAHGENRHAIVVTFFPHPDILLRGLQGRYYLTTPDDRAALLLEMGVDVVITLPFDDALRHIRAADFVDKLVRQLNMVELWVGADFALGYQREGNVAFLTALGQTRGFSTHIVETIMDHDAIISSTTIRQALIDGRLSDANALLGRPYSVSGPVVEGHRRGRTIGYPTANVDVWDDLVLPKNGIYAGWARVGDQRYMAATNIGLKPTFDDHNVTVEAYLLDFSGDLYGRHLTVTFDHRLRDEARFSSIDALIAQIAADVERTRALLLEKA